MASAPSLLSRPGVFFLQAGITSSIAKTKVNTNIFLLMIFSLYASDG